MDLTYHSIFLSLSLSLINGSFKDLKLISEVYRIIVQGTVL
jgi:hypothetical protein